jgi:hypothetical protein
MSVSAKFRSLATAALMVLTACAQDAMTAVTVTVDAELTGSYSAEEPGFVMVRYANGDVSVLATIDAPLTDDLVLSDVYVPDSCDDQLDKDAFGALVSTVRAWITRNEDAVDPSPGDPVSEVLVQLDERCQDVSVDLELAPAI